MYRNNNLLGCVGGDPRGGTVLDPCVAPPTTLQQATQGHTVSTTTTTFSCPISWGDPYNGIHGNFCNWKQTFKANFLSRQRPCNFLELRRAVHQDQLAILQTNGTHPLWQELLQHKLGFIQYLGFNYGCYTSVPASTPQARVSVTPEVKQRMMPRRRKREIQDINRNIYTI